MQLKDVKTIVEIIQSVITTLGILIAGVWSYFIFIVARSHAVNIRIELLPKFSFVTANNHFIVLRVQVQNVGQTKVNNKGCFIAIEELPLNPSSNSSSKYPYRADSPFDINRLNTSKVYQVLTRQAYLEPSEQVSEDIVLLVAPKTPLRAGAFWSAEKAYWSSIHVIVPELLKKLEENTDDLINAQEGR